MDADDDDDDDDDMDDAYFEIGQDHDGDDDDDDLVDDGNHNQDEGRDGQGMMNNDDAFGDVLVKMIMVVIISSKGYTIDSCHSILDPLKSISW